MYYDVIYNALGFQDMVIDNKPNMITRKERIQNTINNVIGDYTKFYADAVQLENSVRCLFNDGKTQKDRDQFELAKDIALPKYEAFKTMYDIEKIDSSFRYAERFPDLKDKPSCANSLTDIYNRLLKKHKQHDKLVILYKQLDAELSATRTRITKSIDERARKNYDILNIESKQKQLKLDIASIQRDVRNNALQLQQDIQKSMNENINTQKISDGYFNTQKGLVNYADKTLTTPNNSLDKKRHYSVYVPYFSMYHLYYNVHKHEYGKGFENVGKNDVIAFLFLKDVESHMMTPPIEKSHQNDTSVKSRSIGERLIRNFWAYEKIGNAVDLALNNAKVKDLMTTGQYIYFEETSRMENALNSIVANKEQVIKVLNTFINPPELIETNNNYTYYILELLIAIKAQELSKSRNIFQRYVNEVELLISFNTVPNRKNTLLAFLNLPSSIQSKDDVKQKFGISSKLYEFMIMHPMFMSMYLANVNPDVYDNVAKLFLNSLNKQPIIKKIIFDPKNYTVEGLNQAFAYLESDISSLKKCLLALQVVNMYTSQYKTELFLKPRGDTQNTKYPSYSQYVSRQGYKTLTNDQIILDYESFFKKLFKPFYIDLVEGRMFSAWRKAFDGKKFEAKNNTGYWREFRTLYVDYIGGIMTQLKSDIWKELSKYSKPRWGKRDEFDKT
jgi:hypothetical protein